MTIPTILKQCFEDTQTPRGSSYWKTWQRCQFEHALRYEHEITPIERASYFEVGKLVHSALQAEHLRVIKRASVDWQSALNYAASEKLAASEDIVEAHRLCKSYFDFYGPLNGGWQDGVKLIAVELELKARDIEFTGRADLVVEIGEKLLIVDTKTRSSRLYAAKPGAKEQKQRELATDPQFLSQSRMLKQRWNLSYYPDVMVNAIVKTKVPSYERLIVPLSEEAVERWAVAQADVQGQREYVKLPVKNYSNCAPFLGRNCEYFSWCHGTNEEQKTKYNIGE